MTCPILLLQLSAATIGTVLPVAVYQLLMKCLILLLQLSAATSCVAAAGVMSYSRVYLEYHTVSQVSWDLVI